MSLQSKSQQTADHAAVTEPRLQYWLTIVPLITSAISGTLALVPQTANLFGPFDYVAEVLLGVCVVGIIVFAIGLIRGRSSFGERKDAPLISRGTVGITLIAAAPVLALLVWYTGLRLPPSEQEIVDKEIALGDTDLNLHDFSGARDHYRTALLHAPRRGSIRARIQDAEDRMRMKGN